MIKKLLCVAVSLPFLATPAIAGAIYTSAFDGSTWAVNVNTVSDPNSVFLNGGPHNTNASGLPPGTYYYQVTDPSGKTLLSTDDISCRTALVNAAGVIYGVPAGAPACSHPDALTLGLPLAPNGGDPIELMPFAPTPNGGGVYKLWLVPTGSYQACATQVGTRTGGTVDTNNCAGSFGFVPGSTKTDNFKIRCDASSLEGSSVAAGGTGYAVGDMGTVNGGTGGTYYVTGVSSGAVTSFQILTAGTGYALGTASTAATSGIGSGFTIDITAIGGQFCGGSASPQFMLSGVKYYDSNVNGVYDNGEALLGNWEIDLTVASTVTKLYTDSNGAWSYPLPPGTSFSACEVLQTGWNQSGPLSTASLASAMITVTPGSSPYAPNCWSGTVPATDTSGLDFGNWQGADLMVTKTATPAFTRTYNWNILKSGPGPVNTASGSSVTLAYNVTASETGFVDSAWTVTGSITVSNPNPVAVSGVAVADNIDNGGSCTIAGSGTTSVPAMGTATFNYSCTFSSNPGSGTNSASATWPVAGNPATPHNSASGTAPYTFGLPTNPVNQTITVTDSFNGANPPKTLGTVSAVNTAPYASTTFPDSYTFPAPTATCVTYANTATITQTGQTSGATVQVCGASPLKVSKTAVTSYNSAITKSVTPTRAEQNSNTVTLSYTVNVTTSGWTVAGNITVTNPNSWEAITANVADALGDTGGACSVTGGTAVTVPKSNFVVLPYTCTFAKVPGAGSGINTATASWTGSYTATTMAMGTAAYAFQSLMVTDCFGLKGKTCVSNSLGTVAIPPGSATFTYQRSVANAAPAACIEYDNTATLSNGLMASAAATVCNTNTGALSMGFWKNKNGQGIITKACGGASGTSLQAFLNSFNPFKDDTVATCVGQASYASSVISGATCSSGGACNSMLKAQMLATALDVYFSTPNLGGNLVGAFNGLGATTPALGGVAIDLSAGCATVDTSTPPTCGALEDQRPVFGIAPPLVGTTVLQMLQYADYLSGVNGSPVASTPSGASWYKQVKASQVLAKDAFDAINNMVANIATGATGSPSF